MPPCRTPTPLRCRIASVALAAALAAELAAQAPPDEASIRAAAKALDGTLLAARVELAESAFTSNLWREAIALAQAVLQTSPDHALGKRTAAIKKMSAADFLRSYKEALAKSGRTFKKRVQQTLGPVSKDLTDLGEAAQRAGSAELAEQLFVRAYEVDSDNSRATQALRKLDYDTIFNYGVLPRDQKERARAVLRSLGGKFLQRSDLAPELEFWVDAWGLETKHYRFVTNAPHATVFGFAEACEQLYSAWEDFMAAGKQDLRLLPRKCSVYLFASRDDYEAVLRLQGMNPPDSQAVLGFFDPNLKICCFYCDPQFYAGDPTLLFETLYHECSHQQIDLRLKVPSRGQGDVNELHWVEEGLCVYLETLVVENRGGKPQARFGSLVDDDLAEALSLAGLASLMPMAEFAHADAKTWDAYEGGYPHAALVVHWLLHGDGGKRRAKLFELLMAERQTGGLRKTTLFDLLGVPADELDKTLRAYAADAGKTLPKRQYKG